MSIGSTMRTSVSGMNAQAARLSAVSENIANSNTTGYKETQMEFSSLVLPPSGGSYNSGAVETRTRTLVSKQGGLTATGNNTNSQKIDLAVSGNGFFVVGDGGEGNYLTRAGSFSKQSDGTLVNAAGYTLRGYPIGLSGTEAVLNGFSGLQDVNLNSGLLSATPTTSGTLTVPLDKSRIAGTVAVSAQAAAYSVTGGASTAGAQLKFDISIDGGAAIPVTVTSTGATGIQSITKEQIVAAINSTTGLNNVATYDATSGKISLKSNSTKSGLASTIEMTNITQVAGTGTLTTASTLTGFSPATPAVTGTDAVKASANGAVLTSSSSTIMTSISVYNNSGEAVKLDVYYTKTNDADNVWEVAVFDSRKASTGVGSAPFPYGAVNSAPLASATLDFNDTDFTLQTITPGAGATQANNKVLNIDLGPIGGSIFKLDIGNTTQYTGKEPPLDARVDGNPAEVIDKVSVGKDGVVSAVFTSGTIRELYKIPLAMVQSPDSLNQIAGNAFQVGVESGSVLMGTGNEGGFGEIVHGSLEESTVDLAGELTTMIEAQRGYTANSKVFQTGSEILEVLVNLKR